MIPGSYVSASGVEVGAGVLSPVSGRKNQSGYVINSLDIIQLGVLVSVRFPLSFRNLGNLLHERGIVRFIEV